MKRIALPALLLLAAGLTPIYGDGALSSERLDMLDSAGYFTPEFKSAVHGLVDSKHELEQAKLDEKKVSLQLPGLQKQATEAEAKAIALRQELTRYDHPEETDFEVLENRMKDAGAQPDEQIELAQAYVWTYPTSPHVAQAQEYLQQLEKDKTDKIEEQNKEAAARAAAHERLVLRAQARDLNLSEWREFLRDTSQDDLVKLIGRPTSMISGDEWIYTGDWITDPTTKQRVGLQILFSAGRVINVDEKPTPP
jgi:hypothetical protein